jgi:putative endonuclease
VFTVYVLRSEKNGRRYTGQTQDFEVRLSQHNSGITKSTRSLAPFRVEYTEVLQSRTEAMKREYFLKSGAGRSWLDQRL